MISSWLNFKELKILLSIYLVLITIFVSWGAIVYFNNKEEVITVSENVNENNITILTEKNCNIEQENYKATIKKYNGKIQVDYKNDFTIFKVVIPN